MCGTIIWFLGRLSASWTFPSFGGFQ
jgi:hypothetical protein